MPTTIYLVIWGDRTVTIARASSRRELSDIMDGESSPLNAKAIYKLPSDWRSICTDWSEDGSLQLTEIITSTGSSYLLPEPLFTQEEMLTFIGPTIE